MINSKCESGAKLRDDQWEKLRLLMLGKIGDPGSHARDNRLFIEAVLWFVSDTNVWADLPQKFGKWNAIYMRVRRWYVSGHWQQLAENLRDDQDLCKLVKKIIAHCDHQKKMREERNTRKAKRETNRISHAMPRINAKEPTSLTEGSTSHWLSLIEVSTK
ncbi:transposase [Collimonas humicola]|uniref:transposase n=1 Tax=Collimonas humicola TaxID=2825886 RepID=UPI001B8B07F9|nr:transposase [Collimonas humicola]